MYGYYTPGEKRIHRVIEADLHVLYNAALCLIELERDRQIPPIVHEVKVDLERAIQRARQNIEDRQKYG